MQAFMREHAGVILLLGGLALAALLTLALARTKGLWRDMQAVASHVVQEIIRLLANIFTFFLRILSTVEQYLTLIIDIFAGNLKQYSLTKLLSISIIALSVASFFTTYSGMEALIGASGWLGFFLRACITFGVQAILLGASIQIGQLSVVRSTEQKGGHALPRPMRWAARGCAIFAALDVLALYLMGVFGAPSWATQLLMALGCAAVVGALAALLPAIFAAGQYGGKAKVLLVVYFGTLCFSSFFSYNSFLDTLYQPEFRRLDQFYALQQQAGSLIEKTEQCFDSAYETAVQKQLLAELIALQQQQGTMQQPENQALTAAETYAAQHQSEYQQYQNDLASKTALRDGYQQSIGNFVAGTPIDQRTNRATNTQRRNQQSLNSLESEIAALTAKLEDIRQGLYAIDPNQTMEGALEGAAAKRALGQAYQAELSKLGGSVNALMTLVQQDMWTGRERENAQAELERITAFMVQYRPDEYAQSHLGGLFNMVSARKVYLDQKRQALELVTAKTLQDNTPAGWKAAVGNMNDRVLAVTQAVPTHFTTFDLGEGNVIAPPAEDVQSPARLVSQLERAIRNADGGLNRIEQNMRALGGNPLLALFCALIAVLVDTLILFVGMLIPKSIHYFKDTAAYAGGKYSPDELDEVLSGIFSKPAGREE